MRWTQSYTVVINIFSTIKKKTEGALYHDPYFFNSHPTRTRRFQRGSRVYSFSATTRNQRELAGPVQESKHGVNFSWKQSHFNETEGCGISSFKWKQHIWAVPTFCWYPALASVSIGVWGTLSATDQRYIHEQLLYNTLHAQSQVSAAHAQELSPLTFALHRRSVPPQSWRLYQRPGSQKRVEQSPAGASFLGPRTWPGRPEACRPPMLDFLYGKSRMKLRTFPGPDLPRGILVYRPWAPRVHWSQLVPKHDNFYKFGTHWCVWPGTLDESAHGRWAHNTGTKQGQNL